MSEINAISNFNCAECGGVAVWNAGKQLLVCPYCGSEAKASLQADGSIVQENDLLVALQQYDQDARGWAAEKRSVRCTACNAISVFDTNRVSQNCDFCGSPSIVALNDSKAPIRPSGLLSFKVAETAVREQIRAWYGTHFFAPNNLKTRAMTDTLKGMYLPFWTFDAHCICPWTADSGTYYYTTDSEGRRQRHVRWTPASGTAENFFDDLLISASKGINANLLEKIQPFPTTEKILPYDPGYISGWIVEQYQVDLTKAAEQSLNRMNEFMRSLSHSQIPGDTSRGLRIYPQYSQQTFKHILLPVWTVNYRYGAKNYQVIVNGCTGKIAGEYPLSWIKVTIAILLGILILVVLIYLSNS